VVAWALPGLTTGPGDVRMGALDDWAAPGAAEPGCVIVGQVIGRDRLPARAVLTLIGMDGRQIARARTDHTGGYRLRFSAGGTYLLACVPEAGTGCEPVAQQVTVGDGALTHDIRLDSAGSTGPRRRRSSN